MSYQYQTVYEEIVKLLKPYDKIFSIRQAEDRYNLSTTKTVTIDGRVHEGLYFAGVRKNKTMVSFYYMPVYMNKPLVEKLPADLKVVLKGKACFNMKKISPAQTEGLKRLLEIGTEYYRKNGWL